MPRATVQIADDHLMFAEPNGRYLGLHYDVHPPVIRLDDVPAALQKSRPSVLLLDISFGRESSLPMLARLVRQHPRTLVVMVTGHADRDMLRDALAAGARGYVLKDGGPAELLLAIETVLSGSVYLSPELRVDLKPLPRRPKRPLSSRQLEVFELLRKGRTERQIADRLRISISAAEKHVRALKENLGIVQRKELVRWRAIEIEGIATRAQKTPKLAARVARK